MRDLGWLMLLSNLYGLASVWFKFFNLWSKHHGGACSKFIFTDSYKWTLAMLGVLTSAVCYICAFKLGNIKEKPLYMAIFLTFISFLILFVTELLIDHRVNVAKLSQSPISFLISTFVVWLLLR